MKPESMWVVSNKIWDEDTFTVSREVAKTKRSEKTAKKEPSTVPLPIGKRKLIKKAPGEAQSRVKSKNSTKHAADLGEDVVNADQDTSTGEERVEEGEQEEVGSEDEVLATETQAPEEGVEEEEEEE